MTTTQAAPTVTLGEVDTSDMRCLGVYAAFVGESKGYLFPASVQLFDAGDGTHVLRFEHTSSLYHHETRKWVTMHHSTRTATVEGPLNIGSLNEIVQALRIAAGAVPEEPA